MSIKCHLPPDDAAVIEVINFTAARGSGSPEDPERLAEYYFSKDGRMLACCDPLNGPPDSFMSRPTAPDLEVPEVEKITVDQANKIVDALCNVMHMLLQDTEIVAHIKECRDALIESCVEINRRTGARRCRVLPAEYSTSEDTRSPIL